MGRKGITGESWVVDGEGWVRDDDGDDVVATETDREELQQGPPEGAHTSHVRARSLEGCSTVSISSPTVH